MKRKIKYDNVDFLELQKKIYGFLNKCKDIPYADKLSLALDMYSSEILHTQNITYENVNLPIGDAINQVRNIITAIKRILSDYSNGRIQTCYRRISYQMQHMASNYTIQEGSLLYRMRYNPNPKSFCAEEMFHVPYSSINLLRPYRYSINGFPCLYICPNPETCWKELRSPVINEFNLSCIKCIEPVKLIDLRWHKPLMLCKNGEPNKSDLLQYIITFPFVIACSIPINSDKDMFHIEYVIPQIFLHNTLLDTHLGDGVIYSSSQFVCDFSKGNSIRHDCIALPARKTDDHSEFSEFLSNHFILTDAVGTNDLLTKYFDKVVDTLKGDNHPSSIFKLMETVLSESEFKKIR